MRDLCCAHCTRQKMRDPSIKSLSYNLTFNFSLFPKHSGLKICMNAGWPGMPFQIMHNVSIFIENRTLWGTQLWLHIFPFWRPSRNRGDLYKRWGWQPLYLFNARGLSTTQMGTKNSGYGLQTLFDSESQQYDTREIQTLLSKSVSFFASLRSNIT